MCQSIPRASASQDAAFKVVLVDSSGQVKDRIGFRFGAPGAQATANGWNKLSVDDRRGLTAEIRPFDFEVPGMATALEFYCQHQDEMDEAEQPSNQSEAGEVAIHDTENPESAKPGFEVFGDDEYELSMMVDEAWLAASRGDYSLITTVGMRYMLCRYLLSIIQATMDNKIQCAYDIGMIAQGLQMFCAQVIEGDSHILAYFEYESDDFRAGYHGEVKNDYGTLDALYAWFNAREDLMEVAQ